MRPLYAIDAWALAVVFIMLMLADVPTRRKP